MTRDVDAKLTVCVVKKPKRGVGGVKAEEPLLARNKPGAGGVVKVQ